MNKPGVIEKTRRELELNYLPKNNEATAKHLPDQGDDELVLYFK